jgi:hypothetical protein
LLQADVATAAPILGQLTGPIYISPTGRKAGNRHIWKAEFTANLLPVLVEIGTKDGLPNSDTLEFLSTRGWKFEIDTVANVDKQPQYELLADKFREMQAKGMSVSAMATDMGMTWAEANVCYQFAMTGARPRSNKPRTKKRRSPGKTRTELPKYKAIADEVVRRRHPPGGGPGDSFARIARDLRAGEQTVRRAYDYGMRQLGRNPLDSDGKVQRGECRQIAIEKIDAVHRLLDAGNLTVKEIAVKTGVSQSTIRREMKKRRTA